MLFIDKSKKIAPNIYIIDIGAILTMFFRGYLYIIAPKMQHIVFYASFSMSYVFLYLIGLAQVISFLFYGRL